MNVSILISTYGESSWADLAQSRALPSASAQGAFEVLAEHDPDGTIATVRNAAAERAGGEWLCFLDADDELAPGYLDAMGRALEQEPATSRSGLLFTPAVQQLRRGNRSAPFFFPECSFETGNWLVIGTLLRRDLFWQVGGFEEYPHGLEDWQLWAKCAKAGARVVKVPDAIYRVFHNASSKHHALARNRRVYMRHYEEARLSVWG